MKRALHTRLQSLHLLSFIFFLFVIPLSCGKDDSGNAGGGTTDPPVDYTIHGYVTCNGTGVAGAVVSDGLEVVKTDAQGYYTLGSDIRTADFVRLSIPSGYEVACKGILPRFYHTIDPASTTPQRFDFQLTRVENTNHLLIVMADAHVSGRTPGYPQDGGEAMADRDSVQFRDTFVPSANAYAAAAPAGYRVYGLNLGDMTHSEYWYSKRTSFPEYLGAARNLSFPVFHAIGNHDYCHKVTDDATADAQYKEALGPTYYSFNLGDIHYIVLDDMVYHGGNTYDTLIDERQMKWLERDLAMTGPDTEIVVAMHVPTSTGLKPDGSYTKKLQNFDAFYALFGQRKVTVLSGDWHAAHSVRINSNVMEYIHPAVCGTWWYRLLCSDGTPAAFTGYKAKGHTLTREIVPFGADYAQQKYRVYNQGVTSATGTTPAGQQDAASATPAILVNFWHWEAGWTVRCFEKGIETSSRGTMVRAYDPLHKSFCKDIIPYQAYSWCATGLCEHLFRYLPSDPGAAVTINVTDKSGVPVYSIQTTVK